MLAVAAFILFVVATILEFAKIHEPSALGLAFAGLACLSLHLLDVWATVPWRRPPS